MRASENELVQGGVKPSLNWQINVRPSGKESRMMFRDTDPFIIEGSYWILNFTKENDEIKVQIKMTKSQG